MKTKNIFKTLAFAMLMPTMLLTTACSSDDNFANNTETTIKKVFELPATVNVTRQGDEGTTRATYNESTKKLSFSAGDKLFVWGTETTAGKFAGTLDMVSAGTFSGTITTENNYPGTAHELFTAANSLDNINARFLPNGYEKYGYISSTGSGCETVFSSNPDEAFALTKSEAVEQLTCEYSLYYNSGFTLSPLNAILNFTITGLTPSTPVNVSLTEPVQFNISKTVSTNASGSASFAVGVFGLDGDTDLKDDLSLTVGGNAITLASSSKKLYAGKIYNILRKADSTPSLVDAFVNGNTTVISFGSILTLTSTFSGGSFGAVTPTGSLSDKVTNISMARSGNNLVITLTDTEATPITGSLIIDIANNTYRWDNEYLDLQIGALTAITIGGNNITLPSKTSYPLLSAATAENVGKVVCAAGHLHTAKTAVPAGCTAVGILGKVTSTGHGLIIALQDAEQQDWNTINGWSSVTTYAGTTLKQLPDNAARGSLASYTTLGSTTVSNWCVAQKDDYEAIFTNLGSTTGDGDGHTYDDNVNAYFTTGVGGTAISYDNWTATDSDMDGNAWAFGDPYWFKLDKTGDQHVRPVLGF